MSRILPRAFPVVLTAAAFAQHGSQQSDDAKAPMYVAPANGEGREQIASFQLAEGLTADLVAAEPDVCNGVAFTIDGSGRLFVCETFRIGDGVFDNRNYMQWKDRDLACKTVADRVAKYAEFLPDEYAGYSAYHERVRLLVDTDNNGTLDRSTIFADGFNAMADGIISGVLSVGDRVLVTNIPKLWSLRDSDDDGVADERIAMHDGFGVHTSLIGHDMHGLIVGPDRRLYFSIGDRGFRVDTPDGVLDYPDEGAVLRCELDGSKLEVVHRGLRNPQELAFDQWGDLFTGDNNSDGGDKARLVQVVPGADSGWRIGFQWLDDRGCWNREKMWHARHPEQTAGILPPIQNFADGPSGLVYDPGLGLPERFRDCFFLCDFRGGRSYSGIRTFRLSRSGAGYEVEQSDKIAWNLLPTDCEFGPDGALYFFDWVNGWGKTGKGRIYRLRSKEMANDFQLRTTARLLSSDLRQRDKVQLQGLLSHADRRVRQNAQFALVDQLATDALEAATTQRSSRLARLHGIWGLGILLRQGKTSADVLVGLLDDEDRDVRAMAVRTLGDARDAPAVSSMRDLLRDTNSRVQREAALALARIGSQDVETAEALLAMARQNDDRDAVLRHAAVQALARVAPAEVLAARANDGSRAVQRAVLLTLARQHSDAIAQFLQHGDEQFRYEAARAIYETPIPGAMQALAQLVYDDFPDSERIDWRAINANRMRGEVENGEALVHMSYQQNHPTATRHEALAVLAEWLEPHGQCRVTGNWRPCLHPDADIVAQDFRGSATAMLEDPVIAAATARAAAQLRRTLLAPALAQLVQNAAMPDDARVAALDALATLGVDELQPALQSIDATAPVPLRKRAIALLSRTRPEQAVPVLATLLDNAPTGEQQAACEALGDLQHPDAAAVLRTWLERLDSGGGVDAAIRLDLLEAAAKHDSTRGLVATYDQTAAASGPLGPYGMCLEGGDPKAGRKVFLDFEATRCTRCHSLNGTGGNAGPALDDVGKRLTPQQLLEALITPSVRIAEGFGTTIVDLHDGSLFSGVITRDRDGSITIVDIDGNATDISWTRIKQRKANAESAMPPMAGPLSKRQIRDLIAFLKNREK